MSIFSRLFGTQEKTEILDNANNPELKKLVEFEKAVKELLDKDLYIACSDYKPLWDTEGSGTSVSFVFIKKKHQYGREEETYGNESGNSQIS